MLINPNKKMGYPVPGVEIDGRKLFMEILETDTESSIQEACAFVERAMKEWADLKPGVKYTKQLNSDVLKPTPIIPS